MFVLPVLNPRGASSFKFNPNDYSFFDSYAFTKSFSPSPIRDAIRDDISSISKYSRPSNLTVSQKPQSKRPSI
jgi:hypothetical protein